MIVEIVLVCSLTKVNKTSKVRHGKKGDRLSIIPYNTTTPLATKTNSQIPQAQMERYQLGNHVALEETPGFAAPNYELIISTTTTAVAISVGSNKPRAKSSICSQATLGEYFDAALPVIQNSVPANNVASEVRGAPVVTNIPEEPNASIDIDTERGQPRTTEKQTGIGTINQALIFFVVGFFMPLAWVIGGWFCSSALHTCESSYPSTDSCSVVVTVPTLLNARPASHASPGGSDSSAPPAWPTLTVSESELCAPWKRRYKWLQHKNGWVRACRWAAVFATPMIIAADVVIPLTFAGR